MSRSRIHHALPLLLLFSLPAGAEAPPAKLVPFGSAESAGRLESSRHKVDFLHLANQFESQRNMASCGPASAVIVLNTVRADRAHPDKPTDTSQFPADLATGLPPGFKPVAARYTQQAFFDDKTEKVKSRAAFYGRPGADGKRDGGLQLRQLHQILVAHGLDSRLRVADDTLDDKAIHKELVENLGTEGDYVIINYFRPVLGQLGGGHISPLAAYDEKSDSFLVLDVNPSHAAWTWVPAALLIKSMRTHDTVENRGYLLVREGAATPAK